MVSVADRGLRALLAHSPDDLCTCSPDSEDRCEYRLVADLINDKLNPPGDDVAEVAVLMDAVERIATFVESLPCTCPAGAGPPDYADSCGRCVALGRRQNVPEER